MTDAAVEEPEPTTSPSVIRPDRKVIFINLTILDASSLIDKKLSTKLKGVPKPLANMATKAATTMATPERVAQLLAQEMPQKLVEKMAAKGMTAAAELGFVQGPYVVVQLQIQSVDPAALVEAQTKDVHDEDGELDESATLQPDMATKILNWMEWFLQMIGIERQRSLQDEFLPKLIQSKMETMMGEVMAEKLDSKGLQAISKVLPEEKQARYFHRELPLLFAVPAMCNSTLRELREAKEAMRPKVKIAAAMAEARSGVQARAAGVREGVKSKMANVKPPKLPFFGGKKAGEKLA
eukprot:scaffold2246_cov162-Amphora_coffeaeformis.AAC.30